MLTYPKCRDGKKCADANCMYVHPNRDHQPRESSSAPKGKAKGKAKAKACNAMVVDPDSPFQRSKEIKSMFHKSAALHEETLRDNKSHHPLASGALLALAHALCTGAELPVLQGVRASSGCRRCGCAQAGEQRTPARGPRPSPARASAGAIACWATALGPRS